MNVAFEPCRCRLWHETFNSRRAQMLTTILCGSLNGVNAEEVKVEVDLALGLPAFAIVGLPEGAVRESKVRVLAALGNCGYAVPPRKITVNLAPADLRKSGAAFDLAIALGVIAAAGMIQTTAFSKMLIIGELGLDGSIRPVPGALPYVMLAREKGCAAMMIGAENAQEAAVIGDVDVLPVKNLSDAVMHFSGEQSVSPHPVTPYLPEKYAGDVDLCEVKGQEHAKRALEIAAAGAHNILMIGPPGSGKTMLARRLASIMPPLEFEEMLDVSRAHSVLGLTDASNPLITVRPFRSPHHTVSDAGLVGGSNPPRPGEVSLAHNGILFLDELPEFRRNVLEVLREPLEEGEITISRAAGRSTFPAAFNLVASMNPCPCGYFGTSDRPCSCPPTSVERYRGKISGPLLDRIDIHVEVPSVRVKELTDERAGESSSLVRDRVLAARSRQIHRFRKDGFSANGKMSLSAIQRFCKLDATSKTLLESAIERLGLSARAWSRILKVARTIADLDDQADLQSVHVAEAIGYRSLDRKGP